MAANEFTPTGDSPRATDDSDGIKGALAAALAEHEKAASESEEGEPEVKETPEPKTEVEGEAKQAPAAGEKTEDQAKGEKTEGAEKTAKTGEESGAKASEPPAHWSAEHKKLFGDLAEPAKAFVLDRMRSMEADYTRKTQDIASLRKEYEAVDQIFTPQRDKMKAAGLTASQVIQGWANAEMMLMNGGGMDLIPKLATAYKLDPVKLATQILAVGGITDPKALEQAVASAGEQQKNAPQPVALPPEVMQRLARVDQVAAHVEGQQRAAAEAEVARINGEIEKFKTATDDKGALLRPFFDELVDDMARLVDLATAAKRPVPPIDKLYEEAIFANPDVRKKHLDGQLAAATAKAEAAQRAAAEKAAAEARAKSEKAKKAGSSVTGSSGSGQPLNGRRGGDSLRSTIASAVEDSETVVH